MYFRVDTGEAWRRHQALLQEADADRLARRAIRHRRVLRRLETQGMDIRALIRTTISGLV